MSSGQDPDNEGTKRFTIKSEGATSDADSTWHGREETMETDTVHVVRSQQSIRR